MGSEAGAHRLVKATDETDLLLGHDRVLEWVDEATPRCEECLDYGLALGPEDGDELITCPACGGAEAPHWPEEVTRG